MATKPYATWPICRFKLNGPPVRRFQAQLLQNCKMSSCALTSCIFFLKESAGAPPFRTNRCDCCLPLTFTTYQLWKARDMLDFTDRRVDVRSDVLVLVRIAGAALPKTIGVLCWNSYLRVTICTTSTCLDIRVLAYMCTFVFMCRVVSCRVVSCRVVSCRVVSCRAVSCRVVS
jgi:hypothetical protein